MCVWVIGATEEELRLFLERFGQLVRHTRRHLELGDISRRATGEVADETNDRTKGAEET